MPTALPKTSGIPAYGKLHPGSILVYGSAVLAVVCVWVFAAIGFLAVIRGI